MDQNTKVIIVHDAEKIISFDIEQDGVEYKAKVVDKSFFCFEKGYKLILSDFSQLSRLVIDNEEKIQESQFPKKEKKQKEIEFPELY